ncbi:MAG TPA: NAD(P)-dependent oxidoreductase [Beijerinckiaceae bacterium]
MTTLVTGAGLIGTAFAREALARGEQVVFVDPEPRADFLKTKLGNGGATLVRADIRDLPALVAAMRAHGVDTVVHTAGLIGGRVQQSLGLAFDINLGGVRNVAEAVRLGGVRRLVHVSTFGVYDSRRMPGGAIDEDFPRGAVRGYGNYKAAQELILEAYAAEHGFELIMLRPANVFGLGHFWSGSGGGAKMQELVRAGIEGRAARIPATETVANEYVYAKDVGRAVDLAATVPMPPTNVFNIGNGVVTPFDELLDTLRALLPKLTVEVTPGEARKAKTFPLDLSRAKQHLGWEPRFSLRAAFEDYIADLRRSGTGQRG